MDPRSPDALPSMVGPYAVTNLFRWVKMNAILRASEPRELQTFLAPSSYGCVHKAAIDTMFAGRLNGLEQQSVHSFSRDGRPFRGRDRAETSERHRPYKVQ